MKTAKEAIILIRDIAEKNGCEANVSYMPALNIKNIICRVFVVYKYDSIYFNIIDDSEFGVRIDLHIGSVADKPKIKSWIGLMKENVDND